MGTAMSTTPPGATRPRSGSGRAVGELAEPVRAGDCVARCSSPAGRSPGS